MRRYFSDHRYLTEEQLKGFGNYEYHGIDTNPFNNYVAMPFCDKIVTYIPRWIAPNILTFSTFLLSFAQYLFNTYFDYNLQAGSEELIDIDSIPDWMWMFSSVVLVAAIFLDALDGKHARRIGACSPVGELLDHCVDTWRLTAPMLICFYSIFGRLEYGLPAYRIVWLLLAVQAVVMGMFWHQYVTGALVCSWGYDLMQYLTAAYYFTTYFLEDTAAWWQCEAVFWGTNAVVTEKFAYSMLILTLQISLYSFIHLVIIFGISIPMQLYHSIKFEVKDRNGGKSFLDLGPVIGPIFLFTATFLLTLQEPADSVIDKDPRAALWLIGIVGCDIVWQLLISSMTRTNCPRWNRLLSMYMFCCFYWLCRPQALSDWDVWTVRIAALVATGIHLHRIICTLNELCLYFGIYMFSIGKRK